MITESEKKRNFLEFHDELMLLHRWMSSKQMLPHQFSAKKWDLGGTGRATWVDLWPDVPAGYHFTVREFSDLTGIVYKRLTGKKGKARVIFEVAQKKIHPLAPFFVVSIHTCEALERYLDLRRFRLDSGLRIINEAYIENASYAVMRLGIAAVDELERLTDDPPPWNKLKFVIQSWTQLIHIFSGRGVPSYKLQPLVEFAQRRKIVISILDDSKTMPTWNPAFLDAMKISAGAAT